MKCALRRQLEEHVDVTDEEFKTISTYFKKLTFRKRQFCVVEGQPARYDFFVLSGLLMAYNYSPDTGKKTVLQFAWENWWISDYQSYFLNTPATLHVECYEDVELLAITLEDREKLCQHSAVANHFFRRKANAGYIALQARTMILLSLDARQRYKFLLDKYPELLQRVPKAYLASYLGVAREVLSRLK
jgi:CRP-like cAMP-binding protein